GGFHHIDIAKCYFLPGAVPLFWWPLDSEFIRQIIFLDVLLISLYNPGHLMGKLERAGLEVEQAARPDEFVVRARKGDGILELFNTSYFLHLIRYFLVSEDSVVEIIQKFIALLGEKDLPVNSRVDLQI